MRMPNKIMMKFKHDELKEEFYSLPQLLQEMGLEFAARSNRWGIVAIVTRVKESISGSSGVHEAGRAIDFRNEHAGKRLYSSVQTVLMLEHFNERYARRDRFNTLVHHGFRGGPCHFHLQLASSLDVYEDLTRQMIKQPEGDNDGVS